MKLLEQEWLNSHLKQIKDKAGNRYTPALNVSLPISKIFDGLTRTKSFYVSIRTHAGKLEHELKGVSVKYENQEIQRLYLNFSKIVKQLLDLIKPIKEYGVNSIPWDNIASKSEEANNQVWPLLRQLREEKTKIEKENRPHESNGISVTDRIGFDIHNINNIEKEISFFNDFSRGTSAKLSNHPLLLLSGLAGIGKTHLLCDLVENQINSQEKYTAVLVFGHLFKDKADLWTQIINQLGVGDEFKKNTFLEHLDKFGKKRKARSLIVIDALNETRPISFWKNNVEKLLKDIKRYPNVALALSVRNGFQDEILTEAAKKTLIETEHDGFRFHEQEAATKFFQSFGLPLPEVPLLKPEFQHPLFLRLLCEGAKRRNEENKKRIQKNKRPLEIFKGHEGATYIFENFVRSVTEEIAKHLNLPKGRSAAIWDPIIEKVASEMVNGNKDNVSEQSLIKIIKTAHPSIDHDELLKELEKSLLLVKNPRYSDDFKSVIGFEYKFPFQKFSDHLIARYLFKKYESEFGKNNKNLATARKYFSKRRKLGRFLSRSWNRGIIEALSIQCPEWIKGVELFEVASYLNNELVSETFIESLIWRRPTAFASDQTRLLKFINQSVIITENRHDDFLDALLSVASIPEHPLNAHFLHKHLNRFSMPKRDSWWSKFLHHQYGSKRAVDRFVDWGWSQDEKSHVADDPIRLCSISMVWFLASSNRFLRDRTTKALVTVLTNRLNIVLGLLEQFKDVNDAYVTERLFAVAYGCCLRNSTDDVAIKKLAEWMYKNIFKSGKPPIHILIRDYARGTIQIAIDRKLVPISQRKINPPYKSSWPKEIPTEESLKKDYYPDDFFKDKTKDRGYLSIWSSVMYAATRFPGDFGKYEIDPALGHWSGRRLGHKNIDRKKLFEDFKNKLNSEQLILLNKTNPFHGVSIKIILDSIKSSSGKDYDPDDLAKQEEAEKLQRAENLIKFKGTLNKEDRKTYQKEIEPYLDHHSSVHDPLDDFDTALGQRWIFKQVVEMGWDSKLHGEFDSNLDNRIDRTEHKAERIGKKYQWTALHQLLALVSDNFEMRSERLNGDKPVYEGPWQLSIRDIDPSCILKSSMNGNTEDIPIFGKYKSNYNSWLKNRSLTYWLKSDKDLPDPKENIEITDDSGITWLVFEGHSQWQEDIPPEREKYESLTRTLWYMAKSYLVLDKEKSKVFNWAKKQRFYGRWMPESHNFYNVFLAEYPFSQAFNYHYIPYYYHNGWTDEADRKKIPGKVLVTDDEYLSSGSSIDCSTEEAIRVKLPAKWIIEKMGLSQKYTDGRFYNENGKLIVFDPTLFIKDFPSSVLIRKDELCKFLKKEKCSIFWTLLGEKQTIGGGATGQPFGWQEISGVYTLDNKTRLVGTIKSDFKKPVKYKPRKIAKTKTSKKIDSILGDLLKNKKPN
jgi:hypothetical protein